MDPAKAALELARKLRPALAGESGGVQGAALAELLSIWLAGHPPELRERLLTMHIDHVRQLVPENAKIMGTGV